MLIAAGYKTRSQLLTIFSGEFMSMSIRKGLVTALSVIGTLSLASPAFSQDASVSALAQNDVRTVGTVRSAKWFSATQFVPQTSSTTQLSASYGLTFSPVGAASKQTYLAQLDLPPGSLVDAIGCFATATAADAFEASVIHQHIDALGGVGSFTEERGPVTSGSGTGTGNKQLYTTFSPITVFGDAGEGQQNTHLDMYAIRAKLTQNAGFSGCYVWYSKQISPAPSTATFTDVPTTHTFFQSIEAVAAAGITTGCAAGKFCPNDYVTRGQMATFMARGLGLKW